MSKTTVLVAALGLGIAAVAASRQVHEPRAQRYDALGVVLTAPELGRVRIRHEDIPGYMPGMTMEFAMGRGEPTTLTPGDRVRFVLRVGEEHSWVENIAVTERSTVAPVALARPSAPARLREGDAIPALSLVDQDGQAMNASDFNGRLTVITFIFTRCPVLDYCPLVSRRFAQLQSALAADPVLARDARLLSITIDPEFDTPQVLKAYAQSLGADPSRWRFAGGTRDDVMRVARGFSVYVERNGALLDHTLATVLVDRTGHIGEIWRGNSWKPGEVVEALRARTPSTRPSRPALPQPPAVSADQSPRRGPARIGPGPRTPSR
jgi:protein SCO1